MVVFGGGNFYFAGKIHITYNGNPNLWPQKASAPKAKA